jgi:predicted alpha-1,6-mannanase (GH76 family)
MRTLAAWYDWSPCRYYEPWVWVGICETGTFEPSTSAWNSANALTTTVNFTRLTDDPTYLNLIHHAFDSRDDEFSISTRFVDDEGWWALAWIDASELDARDEARSKRELMRAEFIFRDMEKYWDSTCGGGVWWRKSKSYKNAIANELFMAVAARLYLDTRRPEYLEWARAEYRWFFDSSGMYVGDKLIVDGIEDGTCGGNRPRTFNHSAWTYNQGVILGALVTLRATNPEGPDAAEIVTRAKGIADTALHALTANGILTENESPAGVPVEPKRPERRPQRVHKTGPVAVGVPDCAGPDCPQFKGIFVRNLGTLTRALSELDPDRAKYARFLADNAASVWRNDRFETHGSVFFGTYWQGPLSRERNAAVQAAALDALIEAIPLESPRATDGGSRDPPGP